MTGYLEAMILAEIVPEQREAIFFVRADDYAHNRWVCGAHYPSDTQDGASDRRDTLRHSCSQIPHS